MTDIFTQGYLEAFVAELNGDLAFKSAARWFAGRVACSCDGHGLWLEIQNGFVTDSGLGTPGDATFVLSGGEAAWRELFSPATINGTINRLFRQGKIQISGNMVQVMRFWKMVFALTEVGDRVPLPTTRFSTGRDETRRCPM